MAGCEINDNPLQPICRGCRETVAAEGDNTPIAWLPRDQRYVEKTGHTGRDHRRHHR